MQTHAHLIKSTNPVAGSQKKFLCSLRMLNVADFTIITYKNCV